MEKIEKTQDRLKVLEKIEEYEKSGVFDSDVEDDPPFENLDPAKIDFLNKKLSNKIKSLIANSAGSKFYESLMRQKKVIFKGVKGLENLTGFKGGAVVTCNHCHMFDNYAVYLGLKKHFKHYRLYKVIRESNYAMPGKIGFLMRNCDTLPIGDSFRLTVNCMNAVKALLDKGKKVLVYPEQGMWWNYRKPRPLKSGAFICAAKSNVPVIPCFITLQDSSIIGDDGFPVQEFTVHILPLIYPDNNSAVRANYESMKNRNFGLWKNLYEEVYGKTLSYSNQEEGAEKL